MTREDINDIINAICPNDEDYEKPCISPKYLRQELEQLALDQEQYYSESNCSEIPTGSTTKNNLGVDAVSRAEVLKLMQDNWHTHNGDWAMQESMDDIRALPSIYPKSDKPIRSHWHGHWIDCDKSDDYSADGYDCSVCGVNAEYATSYCPNCGAKMVEPQESEDKE